MWVQVPPSPPMNYRKCLYCGTELHASVASNCANCGGPLPGRYVPKFKQQYYDWSSGEEPYDIVPQPRGTMK